MNDGKMDEPSPAPFLGEAISKYVRVINSLIGEEKLECMLQVIHFGFGGCDPQFN